MFRTPRSHVAKRVSFFEYGGVGSDTHYVCEACGGIGHTYEACATYWGQGAYQAPYHTYDPPPSQPRQEDIQEAHPQW